MNEMMRDLFLLSFDRTMYPTNTSDEIISSPQLFPLHKMDVYLRFVAAFRHGYAGICYDDQYDLDKIQYHLDTLFCSESVYCRRHTDEVVIFPHPTCFGINSCQFPWSFEIDGERYVDFGFPSHDWSDRRRCLMASIRSFQKPIPRLFHMALMSCSTHDHRLVRTILSC